MDGEAFGRRRDGSSRGIREASLIDGPHRRRSIFVVMAAIGVVDKLSKKTRKEPPDLTSGSIAYSGR